MKFPLKPFGAHKGYGLSLINEIIAGFIGASKPTLRSNHLNDGDKHTLNFYFQVIHPDAISSENLPLVERSRKIFGLFWKTS